MDSKPRPRAIFQAWSNAAADRHIAEINPHGWSKPRRVAVHFWATVRIVILEPLWGWAEK